MSAVSVTDARAILPAILDRVEAGEEITITRHGKPAALMVRPDSVRGGRAAKALAQAEWLRKMLEEARHKPMPEPSLSPEYAEELIREIRAGRDAR